MSQAHDTSKLLTYLDSLETALDDGNPADVLAFLRVLRMNGLDGERSAELVVQFSEEPDSADFTAVEEWADNQRKQLAADFKTEDPDVALDDLDPFEAGEFISVADDISEFDDIESSGLDVFVSIAEEDVSIDEMEIESDPPGADGIFDVLASEPGPEESFPPSEDFAADDFFASSDSNAATPDEETPLSDASMRDDFESDASYVPAASSSDITGAREETGQLDWDHLSALSSASTAQKGAEESGDDAPPQQSENDSPSEEFEVDFALGSTISSPMEDYGLKPSPDDDLDVHSRPTRQQIRADEFLRPPTKQSQSTASDDDDFDFDLEPATADYEEDDFSFGPSTGVAESSASDPSVDEKMAYVSPPSDDSFFPPPITEKSDAESSNKQRTPTPSPFPESPSVAERPTTKGPGLSEYSESEPAQGISAEKRPRQPTPLIQEADAEALKQSQATPSHGTTSIPDNAKTPFPSPAPSSNEGMALQEDELLALGEELSSGSRTSPSTASPQRQRASSHHGESEAKKSYRGEPVIRELGDEPTPDREPSGEIPTGRFPVQEGGAEKTNPFAQDVPTGVQNDPVGVEDEPSFVLEEVERSNPDLVDPETAANTALDRARSLYEEGAFDEAMELVNDVLEADASSQRALELKEILEGELERANANRLGSLSSTPTLAISMGDMAQLDLDHRAGFLLSQIDGMLTFEDILDMSAMSRLETLTLLADLYEQDIIAVG